MKGGSKDMRGGSADLGAATKKAAQVAADAMKAKQEKIAKEEAEKVEAIKKAQEAELNDIIKLNKDLDEEGALVIKNDFDKVLKLTGVESLKTFDGKAASFYDHINTKIPKADHDEIIKIMQDYGKESTGTTNNVTAEKAALKSIVGINVSNEAELSQIKQAAETKAVDAIFEHVFGKVGPANPVAAAVFGDKFHYVTKPDLLKAIAEEIKSEGIKSFDEVDQIETYAEILTFEKIAEAKGGDLQGAFEVAIQHTNDLDTFLATNPNVDIAHH